MDVGKERATMSKKVAGCSHSPLPGTVLYRCSCGNVWLSGKLACSVPKDRGAIGLLAIAAPVGRRTDG